MMVVYSTAIIQSVLSFTQPCIFSNTEKTPQCHFLHIRPKNMSPLARLCLRSCNQVICFSCDHRRKNCFTTTSGPFCDFSKTALSLPIAFLMILSRSEKSFSRFMQGGAAQNAAALCLTPFFNALFRHCFYILSDFHFGNTRNPLIFSSFRASKPT